MLKLVTGNYWSSPLPLVQPGNCDLGPTIADDLENLVLARSRRIQALLEKSRGSIREGKGLAEEDFWAAFEESGKPES
jgi:hypothetical protein